MADLRIERAKPMPMMRMGGDRHEDLETRFWLSTVAIGGWVTLLMVAGAGAYTALFADHGERTVLAILLGLCGLGGASAIWIVPWRRLIASRWRQVALLCWTLSTIALIGAMAAVDGGARSPLVIGFVLPTVFASLAYSRSLVLLVAAVVELVFGALIIVGSPDPGYDLVFGSALVGTALMATCQAGFHEIWRRRLAHASRIDPLTAALNRRGLDEAAAVAFDRLSREGAPVTLLVIDLDLFKAYNDIHGHQAGDALLRWVAGRLMASVGPTDTVARLGGDEFAVLLDGMTVADAGPLLDRIGGLLERRVGHCLGSASAPTDGTSFDQLYRVADSALYRRKLLRDEAAAPDPPAPGLNPVRRRRRPVSADAILAGITEAFFLLDEDWRFAYVNDAAAELLASPGHVLLGRRIWDAFPEAAGSEFERVYRRVVATGRCERFTQHYGPLGSTFSVKATPVPDGLSVYFHPIDDHIHRARPQEEGARSPTPSNAHATGPATDDLLPQRVGSIGATANAG